MKILLLKQVLPIAAFGAAMAGAFSSHTVDKAEGATGPITSYERLNLAGNCKTTPYICETINIGAICRVGYVPAGAQLWGKDANGKCTIEVYMPPSL
jgi:hypothetical protein